MSKAPKEIVAEEIGTGAGKSKWYQAKWIVGIVNLFIITSIVYSIAIIVMGTKEIVPIAMTIPMALFAATKIISQFIK